jgi:excisionase family DNA binding protein
MMKTNKEESMQKPFEAEPPPRLLTIPQVAEYLGVGRAHIYKLINTNGLPVIRLGRSVRIHMTSLQRWLQDQEEITHL